MLPVEKLIKQYKLSKEEHNKVLEILKKKTFKNQTSKKNPSILFVIGQPGSGKTTYIKKNDFSSYININSDEYRKFHKNAKEILENNPTNYTTLTNYDAHLWGDELLTYAIQNGYSVLREKAPTSNSLLQQIKTISSHFDVTINIVVAGNLESLLRTRERYEEEILVNKYAKLSNLEAHNTCYELLPNFLEQCVLLGVKVNCIVQEKNDCQTISITENKLSLLQQIREESNKNACLNYEERINKIRNSRKLRNISPDEWEDLEKIEETYLEIKKAFVL